MNFSLAIPDKALFSLFWPKFDMDHVPGSPCHVNFVKKQGILSGFDDQFFFRQYILIWLGKGEKFIHFITILAIVSATGILNFIPFHFLINPISKWGIFLVRL